MVDIARLPSLSYMHYHLQNIFWVHMFAPHQYFFFVAPIKLFTIPWAETKSCPNRFVKFTSKFGWKGNCTN